jgi:hypothetical protein
MLDLLQRWPLWLSQLSKDQGGHTMIMKSILAATAVAATLSIAAPAAEARHIHVGVGIGLGDPGYYPGYYDPPPPPPRYRPRPVYEPDYGYDDTPDYEDRYTLSCGQGRQIVRRSGFRDVRTVECDGQNYKYTGYRRGDTWLVMVDSRTGEIIRRNRY